MKVNELVEKIITLVNENAISDVEPSQKMKYVIVRTYSAGVFAGELESRNGREVVLRNARRLFRFYSASLSQLAMEGSPDPDKCKFPCEVDRVELLECIEILDVTEKAKKFIKGLKVWSIT